MNYYHWRTGSRTAVSGDVSIVMETWNSLPAESETILELSRRMITLEGGALGAVKVTVVRKLPQ